MRRKELDEIMAAYPTYRNATPACRRRFLGHINHFERVAKEPAMDTDIRRAWPWFWYGWFRQ